MNSKFELSFPYDKSKEIKIKDSSGLVVWSVDLNKIPLGDGVSDILKLSIEDKIKSVDITTLPKVAQYVAMRLRSLIHEETIADEPSYDDFEDNTFNFNITTHVTARQKYYEHVFMEEVVDPAMYAILGVIRDKVNKKHYCLTPKTDNAENEAISDYNGIIVKCTFGYDMKACSTYFSIDIAGISE